MALDQLTKQFEDKPTRSDVISIIDGKGNVDELVTDI
jgi:hypothetical protein